MIMEGVHGSGKVGSDHSMDSCPISTQENSANMDLICEAMEHSNPWTNRQRENQKAQMKPTKEVCRFFTQQAILDRQSRENSF